MAGILPPFPPEEAQDEMKRRAKELQMARKEASKRGGRAYNVGGGFGSSDYSSGPSIDMSTSHQPSKPAYNPPRFIVQYTCTFCMCALYSGTPL